MNVLIDLHDELLHRYEDLGYLNTSKSSSFIDVIMHNIYINDTYHDTSSDDESWKKKK